MFTILNYSSALEYSIIKRYTNIVYYYYYFYYYIVVGGVACEQQRDNTTNKLLLTTVDIYCIDIRICTVIR